jgi:hypothetical protein
MYDLVAPPEPPAAPAMKSQCPQCKAGMVEGAVLCTNCGFDTRTGKVVAGATPAKPRKPLFGKMGSTAAKKPADMHAPDGPIVAGLCMSAAWAVATSVLWFGFAWLTGFTIGYIAVLIGVAAGMGMQVGQRGNSKAGAYAAAGVTLGAILLAKVAVLEWVVLPMTTNHDPRASIFKMNLMGLESYFFSPIGLVIIVVGMLAAYRTASGLRKG